MHQHTSGFLVQRIRLVGLIGFFVIWSLIFTTNILAAPTATWTTPWTVHFGLKNATGLASNALAFGKTSTTDGAINDIGFAGEALSGTNAVAKSTSSVSQIFSIPPVGAEASAAVDFSRSFSLKGSPDGWSLSLTGVLNGRLFAEGGFEGTSASVNASAVIDNVAGQGFSLFDSVQASPRLDPVEQTTFAPGSFEGFFRDGIYTVTGDLSTSASILALFIPGGDGEASFFDSDPSSGFSVRLDAAPVPETINIFGAFAVFGFCGYVWLRRSRAQHSCT